MARGSINGANLARLEAQTRVIQVACRFVFMIFCVAIGFVVFATAIPQRRELMRLEAKLKLVEEREAEVFVDRENIRVEHRALREDPAFLEIHARDRLDYYREGERILSFRENN